MLSEANDHIAAVTPQYKFCRRVLSYACVFLSLVCFADTSIAQSPTAPTVSISLDQPNATAWEGGTLRFKVEISRPLEDGEEVNVSLGYQTTFYIATQGAEVRKVPGSNLNSGVTLTDLDVEVVDTNRRFQATFQTTATFVAGAQTATLQWKFGDDNFLEGDRDARIDINNIESDISPKPIVDPDSDSLALRLWDNDYRIVFNPFAYVVDEGENFELTIRIAGPQNGIISESGLETTTTVMFSYQDRSAMREIDYVPRYEVFIIPPNTKEFIVEIQTLPDELMEFNKLFNIFIDRDSRPQLRLGVNSVIDFEIPKAEVIIQDDDDLSVTITAPRSVIAGTTATFTVARTTPIIESGFGEEATLIASLNSTLTMVLEARETNDEGRDYVPSVSPMTQVIGMFTIPAGERTATYSIPTVDDGVGSSSSRLTVGTDSASFTLSGLEELSLILGPPSSASVLVVPARSIIYIRSKVFLEAPLQ